MGWKGESPFREDEVGLGAKKKQTYQDGWEVNFAWSN